MKELFRVLKKTVVEFFEDDCPMQAAALSYYTVFSLPPLLMIVVSVAGSIFGASAVQARVIEQVRMLAGSRAAEQVGSILSTFGDSDGRGAVAAILGVAALLLGATTAFAQLQGALNQAWNVKPNPGRSEVLHFVMKRLVSFGMILAIAFLTLVSLLVSTLIVAFADFVNSLLPSWMSATVLQTGTAILSLIVFSALFAAMYKFLPDAEVEWSDALLGGAVTALLFNGGKLAIGFYLGNSNVADVFGAAGSLALLLLWTYYSSMILLLGAEFTQVWSRRGGRVVHPEPGAVNVRHEEIVEVPGKP